MNDILCMDRYVFKYSHQKWKGIPRIQIKDLLTLTASSRAWFSVSFVPSSW